MKHTLIGLIGMTLCIACSNGPKAASITTTSDSTAGLVDSVSSANIQIVPEDFDRAFEDFIFNFSSQAELQKERTQFPLPVKDEKGVRSLTKKEWTYDSLFISNSYNTQLFTREEELDQANNTDSTFAEVEWIYLQQPQTKRYLFESKDGVWRLTSIEVDNRSTDTEEESFESFFLRFATDSVFQSNRIHEPLLFSTSDPEDDFSILETTLSIDQWMAFKPELPTHHLSNIHYERATNKKKESSHIRILSIKGTENGLSYLLHFKRQQGKWKLYKYEDTGV